MPGRDLRSHVWWDLYRNTGSDRAYPTGYLASLDNSASYRPTGMYTIRVHRVGRGVGREQ